MRDEFINMLQVNEIPFKVNRSGRLNRADSITVYSKTLKRGAEKFTWKRPWLRVSGFGRADGRCRVTADGFCKYVQFPDVIRLVEKLNA